MSDSSTTTQPGTTTESSPKRHYDGVVYGIIVLFIVLLFGTVTYRALTDAYRDSTRKVTLAPYVGPISDSEQAIINQASDILARAEAAQSSAERVLSFLEGASILIGGALAVAAVYGFRNAQETRNNLEEELETLQTLRGSLLADIRNEQRNVEDRVALKLDRESRRLTNQSLELKRELDSKVQNIRREHEAIDEKFDKLFERNAKLAIELDKARPTLQALPEQLRTLDNYRTTFDTAQTKIDGLETLSQDLDQRIKNVMLALSDLIQANQELLLHNHHEAHTDVLRVLEQMPDNALALYIAGWLEFQYIPDKFETGMERMEKAYNLAPDNPTIMAAYGIVLRRKAVQNKGILREQLFSEAESLLLKALNANPRLLDINHESFWGPIGGLRRDQGRFAEAIDAYEHALAVTPASSYPHGNLASLYLYQHYLKGDNASREKALYHFEQTHTYAQHELKAMDSDYFHLMDIAMSLLMLGYSDTAKLEEANRRLDEILATKPTVEMLQTSRRGWHFLYHATPKSWTEVRDALEQAITKIETNITDQDGTPLTITPTTPCDDSAQETDNNAS